VPGQVLVSMQVPISDPPTASPLPVTSPLSTSFASFTENWLHLHTTSPRSRSIRPAHYGVFWRGDANTPHAAMAW